MPLGLPVETFEDGKLDAPQRLEVRASVPTDAVPSTGSARARSSSSPRPRRWRCPRSSGIRPASSSRSPTSRGRPARRSTSTTRRSGCPARRRIVDGFAIPGHVLERMEAVGRAAVDPPRPAPLRRRATTGFSVETATGTVVLAGVERGRGASRRPRRGAPPAQHVADRLVTVAPDERRSRSSAGGSLRARPRSRRPRSTAGTARRRRWS